jgi:acetyltransferase-like isoleucine patch superfamily enzyme
MPKRKNFLVHESAFVEKGAKVGKGTRIWRNAHLRTGCVVGEGCNIGKNVFIDTDVIIGNRVKVQNNALVYNALIEDDALIGPSACFTNDLRPRSFIWDEKRKAPRTTLLKGASVGANATLIPGVTLGKFSLVGAGAVVTKDVPDYGLVYGNPARLFGFVCECGMTLKESERENSFFCPICHKEFLFQKEQVKSIRENLPL